MTEVWRDIDGYENKYQISNYGRIRSVKKNIILKPMVATNGYLVACLWKDNKQKKFLIHRLVAEYFIDNPNSYPEINHKDEDKTNNNANNLEWCTHLYNMNYGEVKEKISNAAIGREPWNKGLKCPDISLRQIGKPRPHIHETIQSNNKTGFIGVFYHEQKCQYETYIGVNKKRIYLGSYDNIKDAIISRLRAEMKYYGDKAPQKHLFEQYNIIKEKK